MPVHRGDLPCTRPLRNPTAMYLRHSNAHGWVRIVFFQKKAVIKKKLVAEAVAAAAAEAAAALLPKQLESVPATAAPPAPNQGRVHPPQPINGHAVQGQFLPLQSSMKSESAVGFGSSAIPSTKPPSVGLPAYRNGQQDPASHFQPGLPVVVPRWFYHPPAFIQNPKLMRKDAFERWQSQAAGGAKPNTHRQGQNSNGGTRGTHTNRGRTGGAADENRKSRSRSQDSPPRSKIPRRSRSRSRSRHHRSRSRSPSHADNAGQHRSSDSRHAEVRQSRRKSPNRRSSSRSRRHSRQIERSRSHSRDRRESRSRDRGRRDRNSEHGRRSSSRDRDRRDRISEHGRRSSSQSRDSGRRSRTSEHVRRSGSHNHDRRDPTSSRGRRSSSRDRSKSTSRRGASPGRQRRSSDRCSGARTEGRKREPSPRRENRRSKSRDRDRSHRRRDDCGDDHWNPSGVLEYEAVEAASPTESQSSTAKKNAPAAPEGDSTAEVDVAEVSPKKDVDLRDILTSMRGKGGNKSSETVVPLKTKNSHKSKPVGRRKVSLGSSNEAGIRITIKSRTSGNETSSKEGKRKRKRSSKKKKKKKN